MKSSRFTHEQKTEIVRQLNTGTPLLKLCCENQISGSAIYSWRKFQRQQEAQQQPVDPLHR